MRSLFFYQWGWNYERMQGSGYLFTILPQLRKIYGDDTPELKEMMKTHAQFFNTSNFLTQLLPVLILRWKKRNSLLQKNPLKGSKLV